MKKIFSFSLLFLGGVLFFFSCMGKKEEERQKPLVVVSIPPYKSVVEAIGGETIVVKSAMSSSYDPHTFVMTPGQMAALRETALWIGIGEAYEKALIRTLSQDNPKFKILELHPLTPLNGCADGQKGETDLHFWLSPKELRSQVKEITETLSRLWPEHEKKYRTELKRVLKKLDALDEKVKTFTYHVEGRSLVVSHGALGYFCRDYGLVQLSLECEGKGPLPQAMDALISKASRERALCAFTSPYQNPKGIRLVAKTLNIPLYTLDFLQEDVFATIEKIGEVISLSKKEAI